MRAGGVKRGVRIVVVVVVLSIAWLQLALPSFPHEPPPAEQESLEPEPSLKGLLHMPLHVLMHKLSSVPEVSTASSLRPEQIWEIWEHISEFAGAESIQNLDVFGPVQPNTVVIVVQVHNRLNYLRHLIVSLADVRHIDSVLLIFSHDYYDEAINQLIMNIDFCMVLQVFYPHTLQLHPTSFPGHSQGDCPRDTDRKIARQVQCRGNPDLYGHYREPRYTQTKHHWWWKANKVFDSVLAPVNHTGLVLFLEEDHYVSEDLLHMLSLLAAALPHACPHCSLLTLGNYLKNYNWPGDAKKVEISPWLSSKHNMGFAFNRTTWRQIKACGEGFCNHDDYNWDWSLQHVSNTCLKQRLYTMVLRAPRVFHIGECGVHHKKKDCSSKLVLNKVYRTLQVGRRALFPLKLIIVQAPPKKVKKHNGNGGWGDHRDQELCKTFLISTGLFSPLVLEPTPPDTALLPPTNHTPAHAAVRPTNNTALGPLKRDIFPDILPRVKNASARVQDARRLVLKETSTRSADLRAPRPLKMKSGRESNPHVSSVVKQPKVMTVSYDAPSGTATQTSAPEAAAVPHYLDPRHPLNPSHYRGSQLLGHVQDPARGMSKQAFIAPQSRREDGAPSRHDSPQTPAWPSRTRGDGVRSKRDTEKLLPRGAAVPSGLSAEKLSLEDMYVNDDVPEAITYEEGQDMRVHRRSIS